MMQETVENGGRHDIIGKDLAPLFERFVRGNDDRALLVALRDKLEEELGCLFGEGEIAQLVNDQEIGAAQLIEELGEPTGDLGCCQLASELLSGVEQHALSCVGCFEADGDGQVGLAHPRCADEENVLRGSEELQSGQFPDEFLVDPGLKAEVKLMWSST